MAAAANRAPREELQFAPNVPVTVALKYAAPKLVSGMSGERFLFTTCDNRVFFTDPELAHQISELGINVRENFTITKRWNGQREIPATWEVARTLGEQPNGTFVAPAAPPSAPAPATAAPASDARGIAPKPPASATSARGEASAALIEQVNACVDAYAACLEHALTTHNGRVKPDEVKSIFLTVAINRGTRVA